MIETTQFALETTGNRGSCEHTQDAIDHDISAKDLWNMLEDQDFRCALSGRVLNPETAHIDHRIPLSKGGPHRADNLQILHKDVNAAKGAMREDDFIQLCREVVAWADSRAT